MLNSTNNKKIQMSNETKRSGSFIHHQDLAIVTARSVLINKERLLTAKQDLHSINKQLNQSISTVTSTDTDSDPLVETKYEYNTENEEKHDIDNKEALNNKPNFPTRRSTALQPMSTRSSHSMLEIQYDGDDTESENEDFLDNIPRFPRQGSTSFKRMSSLNTDDGADSLLELQYDYDTENVEEYDVESEDVLDNIPKFPRRRSTAFAMSSLTIEFDECDMDGESFHQSNIIQIKKSAHHASSKPPTAPLRQSTHHIKSTPKIFDQSFATYANNYSFPDNSFSVDDETEWGEESICK